MSVYINHQIEHADIAGHHVSVRLTLSSQSWRRVLSCADMFLERLIGTAVILHEQMPRSNDSGNLAPNAMQYSHVRQALFHICGPQFPMTFNLLDPSSGRSSNNTIRVTSSLSSPPSLITASSSLLSATSIQGAVKEMGYVVSPIKSRWLHIASGTLRAVDPSASSDPQTSQAIQSSTHTSQKRPCDPLLHSDRHASIIWSHTTPPHSTIRATVDVSRQQQILSLFHRQFLIACSMKANHSSSSKQALLDFVVRETMSASTVERFVQLVERYLVMCDVCVSVDERDALEIMVVELHHALIIKLEQNQAALVVETELNSTSQKLLHAIVSELLEQCRTVLFCRDHFSLVHRQHMASKVERLLSLPFAESLRPDWIRDLTRRMVVVAGNHQTHRELALHALYPLRRFDWIVKLLPAAVATLLTQIEDRMLEALS